MTDITDRDLPDRLAAREWAANVIAEAEAEDRHLGYHNAARVILALTDPPEPTLAEEITDWAKVADNEVERTALLDTAGRAGRLETEHAEQALRIDELDQECNRQCLEILDLTSERDTALEEVERLKAEGREKTLQENGRLLADARAKVDWLKHEEKRLLSELTKVKGQRDQALAAAGLLAPELPEMEERQDGKNSIYLADSFPEVWWDGELGTDRLETWLNRDATPEKFRQAAYALLFAAAFAEDQENK